MITDCWKIRSDYPSQWTIENENRMTIDINCRAFPVIKLVITPKAEYAGPDQDGSFYMIEKAHVEFEHHEQRCTVFDASEYNEHQDIPERVGRAIAYAILTCQDIDPKRIPDWAKEATSQFLEIHKQRIEKTQASLEWSKK